MRSGAQPPIGSTWHLGSVSEPRPPVGCFPRVRPFPPRPPPEVAFLCSVASSVLRPHPTSHPRTYSAYGYCLPEPARTSPGTGETSQVPHKELLHVRKVSDCARLFACKPLRHGRCCLLVSELDRHLGIRPVSQLNTQPVVSPVNASRLPSRAETSCITRGRGGWLSLTPWKTCTSYPLPAFLAHSQPGHWRNISVDRGIHRDGQPLLFLLR